MMRFSVAVPRWKKTQAAAMLRKYRRLRRPGGLRREYKKLRSLLPGATRSHHLRKKVGVVEAAYQYICELQTALLDKFSTKGIPEDLAGVVRGKVATASDIQALALHLINNSTTNGSLLTRPTFVTATTLALPPPLALPRLVAPSASERDVSPASSHRSSLPNATCLSVTAEACGSLLSTTTPAHSHSTSSCDTSTYQSTVITSQSDSTTSSSPKSNTSTSALPTLDIVLPSSFSTTLTSPSATSMLLKDL